MRDVVLRSRIKDVTLELCLCDIEGVVRGIVSYYDDGVVPLQYHRDIDEISHR